MKIQFPYRCDICGSLKGPSNHWWLRGINTEFFLVIRWDDALANEKDLTGADCYEHLCSNSCVSKSLSKWMGEASGNVVRRSGAELFAGMVAPEEVSA